MIILMNGVVVKMSSEKMHFISRFSFNYYADFKVMVC